MVRALPLRRIPHFPVTAGVGGLAVLMSLLSWLGYDVDAFQMSYAIWEGEVWRFFGSTLLHGSVLHLAFNVIWLWTFGARIEERYGALRTAALYAVLAIGSGAAEHAVFQGGIGLSGVGYGLFGFLWVVHRRDPRLADAMDARTVQLFVGWFFLCIGLTVADLYPVANVAHGVGALLGALIGAASLAWRWRVVAAGATALVMAASLLGSSVARPYVNLGTGGIRAGLDGAEAFDAGHFEDAAYLWGYAASVDPEEPSYWYNRGVALSRLGRSAMDDYARAHALEPDSAQYADALRGAHVRVASAAFDSDDWATAAEHYGAASEIDPRPETLYNEGLSLERSGDEAGARERYERSLEIEPGYEPSVAALRILDSPF